jgi:hypothetical protein
MKTKSMLTINSLLAVLLTVIVLACGKSDEKISKNDEQKDKTTS